MHESYLFKGKYTAMLFLKPLSQIMFTSGTRTTINIFDE